MINKKLTSVILAAAILLPLICACDLIPDRTVETSLPTVPEESTSELTTTSEATEETTEPSAEERIILKTPDGKTVIDTTYVRTIADVTPEMMTADYWIGEDDNEVLMNVKTTATPRSSIRILTRDLRYSPNINPPEYIPRRTWS